MERYIYNLFIKLYYPIVQYIIGVGNLTSNASSTPSSDISSPLSFADDTASASNFSMKYDSWNLHYIYKYLILSETKL